MKKQILILVILMFAAIAAQAQSGGIFTITQSVVAAGGGQNLTSGAITIDGTNGQSIAGTVSDANGFSVRGGFWTANIAPTAAGVVVSGRITVGSNGLSRALVTLTDMNGETRSVLTSSFGYYRFDDVEAGATYIVAVNHKHYFFAPQVISVFDNLTELNFVAEQ